MQSGKKVKLEVQEWRKRLRFLSDIIFATAMTIMILNIDLPDFGHISDASELALFLAKQLDSMLTFFAAFMVVAVYWMKHLEHFSVVRKVDQNYISLQVLFLGSIMLIPFWNSYSSNFPENAAIKVFLSANMVLIGIFSWLSLHYASKSKQGLVDDSISDKDLKNTKWNILTEPIIAALAAGLVYIHIDLWDLAFVLVPVLFFLRKRFHKIRPSRA